MINDKNGTPRRNRIDLSTPAESAIRQAIIAVEEAGCDPLLTDAVVLLSQAKNKVADFIDIEISGLETWVVQLIEHNNCTRIQLIVNKVEYEWNYVKDLDMNIQSVCDSLGCKFLSRTDPHIEYRTIQRCKISTFNIEVKKL